jgi:hypothetical protein
MQPASGAGGRANLSTLLSVRIPLLTFLVLCFLGAGCQDVATTWSADVPSPDGHWLATARSQQWGGPGTAYDATTVYLKQVNGSQDPTEVLLFSHQTATINLKMQWLSPTHLDVTYGPSGKLGDYVSLEFQVVRMSGINISVEKSLSGSSKASQ